MKKMLLIMLLLIMSLTTAKVSSAHDWLDLQPEEPTKVHSALWVEGAISYEQFTACVENFTPPFAMGEYCFTTEGYDKFFRTHTSEFYYIPLAFGLDPRYIFALGISESYYGTTSIANAKHNIFGIGANIDGDLACNYESASYSLFDVCTLLNGFSAFPTDSSWQYNPIVISGHNPNTIEGQLAMYSANSSTLTEQVLLIMDLIFPSKWEVITKIN